MTDKEIIQTFKRECGMSKKDWQRFCAHYATRDISSVIEYMKKIGYNVTNRFKKVFMRELCNQNHKKCETTS